MTKVQKLAAFLVIVGPDSASHVLRNLEESELDSVVGEMTKMPVIRQELQQEILQEFTPVALEASTGVRGGVVATQAALEKGLGMARATQLMSRHAPSRAPVGALQQIVDLEPRQVFNLIKCEQPQTIALILSYLAPAKASQVLGLLSTELRELVVERLATLAPTPVEVAEKLVEMLTAKLGNNHTRALSQSGGMKAAANVLNALGRNQSNSVLMGIEQRNPDLALAIRHKMFTFEDLLRLEASALQRILREVDMRDLAVSLKTASEVLKATLLSCISKRAAETVNDEISFLGQIKLRDVEAAQMRVVETVRRLETEGEIDLGAPEEAETHEAVA